MRVNAHRPQRRSARSCTLACALAVSACGTGRRLHGPEVYEELPPIDATYGSVDGFSITPGTNGSGGGSSGGVNPVRPDVFLPDGALRCGGMVRGLSQSRAQVLLVVDRSGSMNELTSDSVRKWSALSSGLRAVLPRVEDRLALGLLFFPAVTATAMSATSACMVGGTLAVEPAFGNADDIFDAISRTSPLGSTPTASALDRAAALLESIPDETGRRYLLLATDGAPNCNPGLNATTCRCTSGTTNCRRSTDPDASYGCLDDDRTLATLRRLASRGIQTFVMGLSGAGSFTDVLDAMAVAGGRPRSGSPRYYSAESSSGITAALSAITSGVADCFFDLDMAPPDPELVDVRIGATSIGRDPSRRNGWYWSEGSDNRRIEFYGAACDRVRTASGGEPLVAAFGCQAAPAPP